MTIVNRGAGRPKIGHSFSTTASSTLRFSIASCAVKMLFDKIPFVYGSGVIPNQFMAIRLAVKNMIMRMFFEREFVARYMQDRAEHFMGNLGGWWAGGCDVVGWEVGDMAVAARTSRLHQTR